MTFVFRFVALAMFAAACGEPAIEIKPATDADYNQAELQQAVDKYVTGKRSAAGFRELATTIGKLRSGMDNSVAKEAELRLIVLALAPAQAAAKLSLPEQVEALALEVWPTLLAPTVQAERVLQIRDPNVAELQPRADEDGRAYLRRLCGTVLASDCKQVVPELQGAVVAALANRRAVERVRNAVAECQPCSADPRWRDAVRGWEDLDRTSHANLYANERKGHPDHWPVAGNAAEDGSSMKDVTALWREAEINSIGEVVINGHRYLGEERISALRELRADGDSITLHIRPDVTLGQVKGLIADAKKSGAAKVAVVARAPQYPWERKIYWLSESGTTRVGLRPTDSLQLLLHTIDHVAGPGAIARVD